MDLSFLCREDPVITVCWTSTRLEQPGYKQEAAKDDSSSRKRESFRKLYFRFRILLTIIWGILTAQQHHRLLPTTILWCPPLSRRHKNYNNLLADKDHLRNTTLWIRSLKVSIREEASYSHLRRVLAVTIISGLRHLQERWDRTATLVPSLPRMISPSNSHPLRKCLLISKEGESWVLKMSLETK